MLVSLLLLGVAAASALQHHGRRSGWRRATLFLVVLLLGSGALLQALSGTAVLAWLAAAMVAVGLARLYEAEPFPGGRAADVYPGERLDLSLLQALVAISIASFLVPVCLVLFVPVLAAARRGRRPFVWLVLALFIGLAIWRIVLPLVSLESPVAELTRHLSPSLLTWNGLYMIAGRNLGILVWFLPAISLALTYRRGSERGALLFAVIAGTFLLPVFLPHSFAGGPAPAGNPLFLALYVALWFVPARVPGAVWLGTTAIVSGLFLWPAWLAPMATAAGTDRPALHRYSAAHHLLYETTQEHAPASAEWQGTGVLSRALGSGLVDGDRGPALVPAAGPARLMIAAQKPLEAVLLDFGPEAKTELRVEGGETGNTVFRPDGGVRFEIVLDDPDRTHPMWFSPKRHFVYLLEIEMRDAPAGELPVAIMARPEEALPRSLDPSSAGADL